MKNPTIKNVSALAGVAPSTVSLVINDSPKVSRGTRQKVLDAIEELKYSPNSYAASLRQTKKNTFGIIVPDIKNPYYIEIIQGLKDKCDKYGYMLHISETNYDIDKEIQELNFMKRMRVNGYVFVGTSNDEHLVKEITDSMVVFIDKIDRTGKIPYIVIDNKQSIYKLTSYLINKGCKNIYYISQTPNTEILFERLAGYEDAMLENGFNCKKNVVISNDLCLNKLDAGYNCIKNIIRHDMPDAVVTTSDLIALGVLRGLHEKNINVPNEISVTGFDNIDYTQYSIPSLTTVNQPRVQMGEIAFSYLVNSDIDVSLNNKVLLISDFIIRESVKK